MTDTQPEFSEDVRKCVAEQAISEEEALAKGKAEQSAARWTSLGITRQGEAQRSQTSKENTEKGSELYAKA